MMWFMAWSFIVTSLLWQINEARWPGNEEVPCPDGCECVNKTIVECTGLTEVPTDFPPTTVEQILIL
jgi:hypothetical protein